MIFPLFALFSFAFHSHLILLGGRLGPGLQHMLNCPHRSLKSKQRKPTVFGTIWVLFEVLSSNSSIMPCTLHMWISFNISCFIKRSPNWANLYFDIYFPNTKTPKAHKGKCFEAQFSERANVSLQRQELWRGQTNCVWPIYGSKPPQTIVALLPLPILMIATLIHHYVV